MAPAARAKKSRGRVVEATIRPTQVADPVNSSINQAPATDWRKDPTFEKMETIQSDLNSRIRSGATAWLTRRVCPLLSWPAMDWDRFTESARQISWIAYLGTADLAGRPHVAPVSPGFTHGAIWFATRASSKKWRNLTANPEVAFHWPVGGASGPGELAAWGTAIPHVGDDERHRIWDAGILPYDLSGFFQSPDNPDVVFAEVVVGRARLLGPDHVPDVWTSSDD